MTTYIEKSVDSDPNYSQSHFSTIKERLSREERIIFYRTFFFKDRWHKSPVGRIIDVKLVNSKLFYTIAIRKKL